MKRAEEFHAVRPGLFIWQAYEPAVKAELTSCARVTARGLVFIDPLPLAEDALDELVAVAPPAAIVLTSGNHARAAEQYRARFSIPIHAHSEAAAALEISVDHTLADGSTLFATLAVIALPGAAPGEIALHADSALHIGDALIHLPPHGLAVLPDKYCTDPRELRRSLGKLLRFPFEVLTFAHGLPIVARAGPRFAQLLS